MRALSPLLFAFALFGCAPGAATNTDDDGPTIDDTGGGDDTATADPTWYHDVQPVVQRVCGRCHVEGGVATSLMDAEDAIRLAPLMSAYVQAGTMPPPAPAADCQPYEAGERFAITDDEKALIVAWAEAGAPAGDPSTEVRWEGAPLTLAPFDAELRATVPYAPDFDGDGNDYRCFLLDVGNSAATFVTGMEAMVDNAAIVHHVVLFDAHGRLGAADGYDPSLGFPCSGVGEAGWEAIGAWGPGANPTAFPPGMGLPLGADAQLVLQMHYFEGVENARGMTDQSGYGLTLVDDVDLRVTTLPFGPTSFTIPAGDAAYRSTSRVTWRGDSALILGAWPHMHLLGSAISETISRADDTEACLLRQDTWDYHNQVVAGFLEPVPINAGDVVRTSCTWDNSADNPNQVNDPPIDVPFGELTTQEMCFVFTYVAQ